MRVFCIVRLTLTALTAMSAGSALANAQDVNIEPSTAAEMRGLIDGLIGENEPGYAVGVVIDGEVAFTHYAGLSNLDTPTPIDERTRFNIASVAKQYTALMVLELIQSGQLSLDRSIQSYLPDALPGIEQPITLAQLLTHTSGLRDVYDLFFLTNATWYETDFDNGTALGLLENQTELNFEPGTDHIYSNSNYILLAALIEDVTGEPFPAYADAFFAERGMSGTTARRRAGVVIPRLARAYNDWGSGWLEFTDIANTSGDGFVYATLPDQLHWERQVWGNDATLPESLIETSQAPLTDEYPAYGFGLEFGFYRGVPITYHEGATGSYNSYTLRFPDQKVSIITMGNTGQVNAVGLGWRIADAVMGDVLTDAAAYPTGPDTIESPGAVGDYLGLYELEGGDFIRLTERDGELFREMEWRDPVRLIPDEGNVFTYASNANLKLALGRTATGEHEFTLYMPNVAPRTATRIAALPIEESYPMSVEGTFFNDETQTEIILQHVENTEYTMIKNGRPRTLELVGRDYLVWNSYRITVLRGETGEATGLSVDRGRIRNVSFDRVAD